MKKLLTFLLCLLAVPALAQTPGANIRVRADQSSYLMVAAGVASGTGGPLTPLANLGLKTDSSGNLLVVIAASSSFAVPQTFTTTGLGTTTTSGIIISNTTAALVGATVQVSPTTDFCGAAWKSNATAASEADCWHVYNKPVTGAAVTTQNLVWESSIAGGAYVTEMELQSGDSSSQTTLWLGKSGVSSGTIGSRASTLYFANSGGSLASLDSSGYFGVYNIKFIGGSTLMNSSVNGKLRISKLDDTTNGCIDITTDAVFKLYDGDCSSASVQIQVGAGSVGAPSYSFTGTPTIGMYDAGSGFLGFATNSTSQLVLASGEFRWPSTEKLEWLSGAVGVGSVDTIMARGAAAKIKWSNGGDTTNICWDFATDAVVKLYDGDCAASGRLFAGTVSVGAILGSGNALEVSGTGYFSTAAVIDNAGALTWTSRFKIAPSASDGKTAFSDSAATHGVCHDVTVDGTLRFYQRDCSTDTAILRAKSYSLALNQAQPADQTARSSSGGTFVMMGLGAAASACTVTPTSTGRVVFTINGDIVNNTTATTISIKMAEGTGAAPANNAAATGTVISRTLVVNGLTSELTIPFSLTATVTGLAVTGTAVWFDLQLTTSGANTGQPTNIDCTAHEI